MATLSTASGFPYPATSETPDVQRDLKALADYLEAHSGTWSTYTPALTATTTNPTLGTGAVQTGRYVKLGKTAFVKAKVSFGTTGMAAGTGAYQLSLPPGCTPQAGAFAFIGNGYVYDSSAASYCYPRIRMSASGLLAEFIYPATYPLGAATSVGAALPMAFAASDEIGWDLLVYETT